MERALNTGLYQGMSLKNLVKKETIEGFNLQERNVI